MLSKFDENERPLLEKWGQKVTQKMFDGPGKLSIGSRRELLDIIEKIKTSEKEVLLLKPNAPKITSSLPYVLGLACAVGQIPKDQVDLTKPILVVGSSDKSMAKLQNMLSSSKVAGTPYLMKRGFIQREDLQCDSYYRTFMVRNISDAKRVAFMDGQYDIILSNDNLCDYLSSHSFSIVVANGSKSLKEMSIRNKFEEHCQVIVLRYDRSQIPVISSRPKSARFSVPHLVHWSKTITEERIRPFLSPLQFEALELVRERISSGSSKRFPIEINTSSNKGIKTILATFPYLLGNAVLANKECMELHKPVLMVAMENKCWSVLRNAIGCENARPELLTVGLMTEEEFLSGCHYNALTIEDEFGLCTYDKNIFRQEVVLIHYWLLCNSDNRIKEECKKWNSNSFSAVVIFHSSTHSDVEQERELIRQFCGISTIFLRFSRQCSLEIEAPTVISTIQHFGAETISPKLLGHCKNIKCDYLLGCSSILNHAQQTDLVSLINWIMSPRSQSQTILFKTNIGYDKASVVLLCLPFLMEWAKDNHLVPPRSESDKPLLLLCTDGSSLKELCTNSTFHQQTLFSADKCRHCKFRSYLVADEASAINTKQYRNCKIVISEVEYLKYIPDNCFSSVIVFSKGELDCAMIPSIKHKFSISSKLAFIEAYSSAVFSPLVNTAQSSETHSSCALGGTKERFSPSCNSRYTSTPEYDGMVIEEEAENREHETVKAFQEEGKEIQLFPSPSPSNIIKVTELSIEDFGSQTSRAMTNSTKSKGNARRKSFLQSAHFWKHENRKAAPSPSPVSEDAYVHKPEDDQTSSEYKNESPRGIRKPTNNNIECFYMVPPEDRATDMKKAAVGCLDVVSVDEKESLSFASNKRMEIGIPKIIHVKPKLDYQDESF